MTVYGYVRVHPEAPAGGLDRWEVWLTWQGCERVAGDAEYDGRRAHRWPGFDKLFAETQAGDVVRTPDYLMLSRFADDLRRRGVRVEVIPKEKPPAVQLGQPEASSPCRIARGSTIIPTI